MSAEAKVEDSPGDQPGDQRSGSIEGALYLAIGAALRDALPAVVDELIAVGGPRAYSVAEVARRLDVSPDTVRRLIAAGHLVTVPHLTPKRVAARTLDTFLGAVV